MSEETIEWLNRNTLIGHTDERGNAWHNRHDLLMADGLTNHYPGAIPAEDVERRLFNFEMIPGEVFVRTADGREYPDPTKKGYVHSGAQAVSGIVGAGHKGHPFGTWLVGNVLKLVSDEATIGSAGLLRNGAQAWVQIELSESVKSRMGVAFRPHILAATSYDGSLASTFKPCFTIAVCDNTMRAGLSENGAIYRVKHTSRSEFVLADARAALSMIETTADQAAKFIDTLAGIDVSDAQWAKFVEAHAPIEKDATKPSITRAENKRQELTQMWTNDARVAPWAGTAWGVVQAVNTYNEHIRTVKRVQRYEAKMRRAITGAVNIDDATTIKQLSDVMGRELISA